MKINQANNYAVQNAVHCFALKFLKLMNLMNLMQNYCPISCFAVLYMALFFSLLFVCLFFNLCVLSLLF